jgi:O-antigen/teichoic acid export membrane protein
MGLGVVSAVASLLLSVFMLRASMPSEVGEVTPQFDSRNWWSSAVPMAMTEGMRVLQGHLSVLVLGWLATTATVGQFRVASSVAVLLAFPLTLFALVGSPIIARLHAQKDQQRLQRLLSWLSLAMTASAALGALPFILFGEPLLTSIFGNEFSGSNSVLLVLCLGALLTGCFGVNAVLLNMTGHSKSVARASVVSLSVSIFLNPAFAFMWGGLGAAWATVLSVLVWNLLMWRDGVRLLSLDSTFWPLLRKILIDRLP